jgi:hypothetical protein
MKAKRIENLIFKYKPNDIASGEPTGGPMDSAVQILRHANHRNGKQELTED